MIILVDNYDSFTFNLYQYLAEVGKELEGGTDRVQVYRNDQINFEKIREISPSHLVISPGPGRPEKAGNIIEIIQYLAGQIPILGVCLGHQAIGIAFGGKVVPAQRLMHGKVSTIYHDGKGVYRGLANPFPAVRYHSLALDSESIPPVLEVSSRSEDGEIMGIRHREFLIEGVQFHPESILTPAGKTILRNFLEMGVN